jgi:lysophospholipase L1-like esterase
MSARGRLLSGLVTIVMALAGFVTIGAMPAAANSSTVQYVALGDSYAAGQGAPPYFNEDCLRSAQGYPALLDSEKHIHLQANETCTGAEISEVADTLSALNRGTRLVTLTVGAVDLDVSSVAAACTTPGMQNECVAEILRVQRLLGICPGDKSALDSPLTDLYAEVANAAPKALVVVTGYPLLFEPPADPNDLNAAIIAAINKATTDLNCVIERAVGAADPTGEHIVYVDVTKAFEEHGIGGELQPFINPPGTADAFHPTAAGYVAYANAISATLPKAWLDKQKKSA